MDCVVEMRKSYGHRRRLIVDGFNEAGLPCHTPGGAFYAFPDIRPTGLSSKEFAMGLLEAEDVACVPGMPSGRPAKASCAAATPRTSISSARPLERIGRYVSSLERAPELQGSAAGLVLWELRQSGPRRFIRGIPC